MIRIGGKNIDTNVFLAPLSGCTDLSFRLIAREHGCGFAFFEMLDANSVVRRHRQAQEILKTNERDAPIAAQILGADPSMMLDAGQRVLDIVDLSFLDINCACPVKKAIKKRAGAYLLRTPKTLAEMVRRLASAVKVPVTVKIRIGYDRKDAQGIADIARACEASGAAAVFVHGRLAVEGYGGRVDYGMIRTVKETVSIPVFGMGNILTGLLAKKMLDETGCDGIGVARGAFGNPWIFAEIDEYLKNGKLLSRADFSEKKRVLKRHLSYLEELVGINPGSKVGVMRKVALWYLKNFPNATKARALVTGAKSYEALVKLIDSLDLPS